MGNLPLTFKVRCHTFGAVEKAQPSNVMDSDQVFQVLYMFLRVVDKGGWHK